MTVALLNTNTRAHGIASPLTVAMNVNAGGTDTVAFVDVEFDQAAGMSITSVTLGGQAMTSCGTPSHSATQDAYTQSFFLKNPPTGTGGGAPSLVVTASGTVTDIYCNLSVYQFVNQTNPVRPGTYQSSNSQTSTAGGQFSMTVSSNTLDRTYTAINSPGGNTGTNQTSDGIDTSGAYSGASDHCTTPAASVTHTWSGLAATGPIAMIGFSINGDPNAAPSTGRAGQSPGRNPGRFQPSERQPTAGFVPGATPDLPFSIRSLGPTSRGGRFTGPGGRPRQWAYVAPTSFAQSMSVPTATCTLQGVAPTLTAGAVSVSVPVAAIRLLGQAPTLTPGATTRTPAAAVIRLLGQAPTLVAGAVTQTPAAAVIRLLGLAPTYTLGAVSLAPTQAVIKLVAQAPTLSSGGQVAPAAAAIRLLAQAPTFALGGTTRTPNPAVVRLLANAPTMSGGAAPPVVTDDRRRRWTGGVLRGR